MKKSIYFRILAVALVGLTIVTSCSEDTDPNVAGSDLSIVEDELEINRAFEDVDFLTLDLVQTNGLGFRTTGDPKFCSNTKVTHDLSAKKITLDFGAGCTSPNGTVRKGKIILTYSGNNFLFPGTSITATLEGFEVNGLKVSGTRTITNGGIDLRNSKLTLNVKVENGKVTWPDNTFATYTSNQVREVSLKGETYEASITGSAAGKSREGFDYTATIKTPLLVKEDCVSTGVLAPSSGVVDFSYRGIGVSVDYGNGSCDKVVKVTYPGGTKEITLD